MFTISATWIGFSPTGPRWNGADFVGFWVPAKLAATGHWPEIYDQHLLLTLQQAISGHNGGYLPWTYPPTFLLVILPLAALSYNAALFTWLTTGLIVYWAALRNLIANGGFLLALACPGVLVCLVNGHAEFLLAGVFGCAMLQIDRRPYLAGLLIGACAIKPHLFLMVPVALIAGARWRAVSAAAAMVLFGAAASAIIFGEQIWRDFFSTVFGFAGSTADAGVASDRFWSNQLSVFAFGLRLGGPPFGAILHVITVALVGLAVALTWAKKHPFEERLVVLCCGTLLASPYLFDYDLVLLAAPIALAVRNGLAQGFRPWQESLLAALWIAPLFARLFSRSVNLPATAVLLGISLALFMRPGVREESVSF